VGWVSCKMPGILRIIDIFRKYASCASHAYVWIAAVIGFKVKHRSN
jgi:hypothetical protein